MSTLDEVLQACEELGRSLVAAQPAEQLRQDRAREVALQCAVEFLARTDIAGLYHVLEAANDFLPFLLGKDKPTL